jgi:hypothetical protein
MLVFIAAFLRLFIWSTGGEHLQTRLGLGIFQLVLITMFLVMFSTKEICSYNQVILTRIRVSAKTKLSRI